MESGTPGMKATSDGWLNRYCSHDREHADTPFRAVAFGPAAAAHSRRHRARRWRSTISRRSACACRRKRARDRLHRARSRSCTRVPERVCWRRRRGKASRPCRCSSAPTRRSTGRPTMSAYPPGRLGRTLLQIAQLIKADVGTGNRVRRLWRLGHAREPGFERGAALPPGCASWGWPLPPSRAIWATACATSSSSRCPSSVERFVRTATAAPITDTRRQCSSWAGR